ncbi:RNA-binding S4 domain-containing protein [Niveispirillum fermenti]|uniref:RNA-binding S4 domain-containing protein n=1 Tax=Niveispirillum fermenti TaxID=1233113 RepID=UPI003A89AE91
MTGQDITPTDPSDAADMARGRLRLDKWLWYARFLKTRSQAAKLAGSGTLRLGGAPVSKSSQPVKVGDVLTFPLGAYVRVIRVTALAARRGPAAEAQALYEDLDPPTPEARLPRG